MLARGLPFRELGIRAHLGLSGTCALLHTEANRTDPLGMTAVTSLEPEAIESISETQGECILVCEQKGCSTLKEVKPVLCVELSFPNRNPLDHFLL